MENALIGVGDLGRKWRVLRTNKSLSGYSIPSTNGGPQRPLPSQKIRVFALISANSCLKLPAIQHHKFIDKLCACGSQLAAIPFHNFPSYIFISPGINSQQPVRYQREKW